LERDSVRGAGDYVARNVKQVIEIDRFVGLKSFVGKRDSLILNPLFNFEPVERFENWSDVRKLWSFGHNHLQFSTLLYISHAVFTLVPRWSRQCT